MRPPLRKLWEYRVNPFISEGPLVANGKVFLYTFPITKASRWLYCLDLATGQKLWKKDLTKQGQIGFPVFEKDSLFGLSASRPRGFMRVREDGELLWHTPVEDSAVQGGFGFFLQGDLILSGFENGGVVLLRSDTGAPVWRQRMTSPLTHSEYKQEPSGMFGRISKGGVYSTFIPWEDKVLFPLDGERLVGFDLQKREVVWDYPLPSDCHVKLRCLAGDVLVYFEYSDTLVNKPPHTVALSLPDKRELRRWPSGSGDAAYLDGTLYLSRNSLDAIDPRTGEALWSVDHSINAAPTELVVAREAIYVAYTHRSKGDGALCAYDPKNGNEIWRLEGIDPTIQSQVMADGRLITTSADGIVTCYEPQGAS